MTLVDSSRGIVPAAMARIKKGSGYYVSRSFDICSIFVKPTLVKFGTIQLIFCDIIPSLSEYNQTYYSVRVRKLDS